MKKFLFVLIACLFMTGCGENKVVCSMNQEASGMKMTIEVTAPVKDNKVSSASTKMIAEFKTEKEAKSYCKSFKNTKGVKCEGKKVIMEEASENEGEAIAKKDFIKSMEDEGFKCK